MRKAIALTAALLVLASPALAQERQTSVSDLEDEVMCPVCGTPLALAENAPQAQRERAFIERLVDQGKSKEEIKDALVAEFGPAVLALPDDEGFELTAYLVPVFAILAALGAIAFATLRWRRPAEVGAPHALDKNDAARLDEDLERYEL